MQLYPILVVAVILAADSGLAASRAEGPLPAWASTLIALGPVLVVLLLAAGWVRWCRRRLGQGRAPHLIMVGDRMMNLARWLILAAYAAAVLLAGWLDAVRAAVGDLILLDELVAMLPPILGAMALWWLYYPIERTLREALLVRRLDLGKPVYAIPRRLPYVVQQFRLHMLLLLVPILLILAAAESIHLLLDRLPGGVAPEWLADGTTFAAGLAIFLFAPLLARIVLSVRPLSDGPVRDDLMEICRRYRVRVREVLLWKTDGSMMNAAVMGLIGPLRYVLLTDALIETMGRPQLQAVMAHEIGHVRRHHMPWLVMSLLAVLLLAGIAVTVSLLIGGWLPGGWEAQSIPWIEGAATALAAVLAVVAFGWISRRFERQADTFAVQHLSAAEADAAEESGSVTAEAAFAMHSALQTIARLNTVDPHRRSWRHGSIAWRQAYLTSIIGHPLDALPIDRFIRRIKLTVAVILLLGGAGTALIEWQAAQETASDRPHLATANVPPAQDSIAPSRAGAP